MAIITKAKELFAGELCAIVGDNGVWDPEAVNDVSKEEHRHLTLDLRDWPSFDPL
jgi:hypothetical protein